MVDEDLQSASSDESRPQSRLKQRPQDPTRQRSTISTGSTQDSVDAFGAHQIWYPPPPAYEEEDRSQVRPPPLPPLSLAPGFYPTTRSPDGYPNIPAAYPLSPAPGPQIIAPVPKRPSDVIDINNMSSPGQNNGNAPADNETRPGFYRSLPSSREFVNPNSAVRSSDQNPAHGVQLENKMKSNRRKRKWMTSEGGDGGEDGMNVDRVSGGETAADADEEMDEDGSEDEGVGDETFTTPKVRTMAVDSDAEMGDASASEQENSCSLQTPLPLRRNGKRARSNITIRRPSSTVTLNPRKHGQGTRLKAYPTSPPRPFPLHLAPQISTAASESSGRSVSTTLSTSAGGDPLMTGDERDETRTPLSPSPSPVTYAAGTFLEVSPTFPIPDVDPAFTLSMDIRGKRLFPRTQATSARSRPPALGGAISSSSSGGAHSRASSRSRGSRKPQGLQPAVRKRNVGGPGLTRPGVRAVAKVTENVPIPILIPVSDTEDVRQTKEVTGAYREIETHSDATSLNKKQKIFPDPLRKTSSLESKAMHPPKQKPTAPQKPIRITRSTSSGTSASSSNVRAGKKVGFAGKDKPAVRATRVRGGGAGSTKKSGG
ncbi:hypothetical protein BJ322DRAFT_204105 [Thelephora terrestris]|uniref:Uncharacterized protein n=1 Tax=Thelephora terrestris TaxID=56493 RepID=A0A9P6L3V8_9AGAM|nr:hypothetical protein BJ322DRAFT_204105 [Thelephora terrestris]